MSCVSASQADRHCVAVIAVVVRRDIPRKIVRVLWEIQFPDNFTPGYISEFSLKLGDDRASASSHRAYLSFYFRHLLGRWLRNLIVFVSRIALSDLGYRILALLVARFTSFVASPLAKSTYCCLIPLFNFTFQSVFRRRSKAMRLAYLANHCDLVSSPFILGSSDRLGIALFLRYRIRIIFLASLRPGWELWKISLCVL